MNGKGKEIPEFTIVDTGKFIEELKNVLSNEFEKYFREEGQTLPTLFSTTEARSYLGVSQPTMDAWEKRGWLRALRFGNVKRYALDDIADLVRRVKGDERNS